MVNPLIQQWLITLSYDKTGNILRPQGDLQHSNKTPCELQQDLMPFARSLKPGSTGQMINCLVG